MDKSSDFTLLDHDDDMGKVLTHGPAFGIPSVYLGTFIVTLMGGFSPATAAVVSVVPALVGGPYFGGLVVILHARFMDERAAVGARHRKHHFRGIHIGHA